MRNNLALILLYSSWPVCLVNRFWNNAPSKNVSWIILDRTVNQDFRWYMVYNELWLSAVLVLLSFVICTRKTKSIRILVKALICVSLVDIVNYWLWFRRNENALILEGVIMLVATVLICKNESTKPHEKAS